MRELVLEKRLAGEVLEIRIMNPAIAHGLVGQAVDVLEQEQPDDEPGLDPRPALVAIERRDLAVDPVPVDLAGELHQLVLHVDDLVEPGTKQIAFLRRLRLLRSHRPLRCDTESCPAIRGNLEHEIASFRGSGPQKLAIAKGRCPEKSNPAQALNGSSRATGYAQFAFYGEASEKTISFLQTIATNLLGTSLPLFTQWKNGLVEFLRAAHSVMIETVSCSLAQLAQLGGVFCDFA